MSPVVRGDAIGNQKEWSAALTRASIGGTRVQQVTFVANEFAHNLGGLIGLCFAQRVNVTHESLIFAAPQLDLTVDYPG
jgi:hypothetical protein